MPVLQLVLNYDRDIIEGWSFVRGTIIVFTAAFSLKNWPTQWHEDHFEQPKIGFTRLVASYSHYLVEAHVVS